MSWTTNINIKEGKQYLIAFKVKSLNDITYGESIGEKKIRTQERKLRSSNTKD